MGVREKNNNGGRGKKEGETFPTLAKRKGNESIEIFTPGWRQHLRGGKTKEKTFWGNRRSQGEKKRW